jgi:hypothetical protein
MDHFGAQCELREQVDQIAERGREIGILVEPPRDAGGSVGYFTMLRDPDGRLVEFTNGQPIEGLYYEGMTRRTCACRRLAGDYYVDSKRFGRRQKR